MIRLDFEGVRVRQGAFTLRVDGRLGAGTLGLSGKSGSGKTTFLELLVGLRPPDQGSVRLGGRVLDDAAQGLHVAPRKRKIGYVGQDADLFPHLDVRRNLLFGAARASAGAPALGSVVPALGLEGLLGRGVQGLSGLSGGERRRVALGRALLSGPEFLVLDEPFGGLDARARSLLRDSLKQLHRRFRIPWILVSHDPADLRGLCEKTFSIRGGIVSGI
ncbi:MAG TPA: ATP-binding cassette domain-containing protein [bacterium]|jgi:molybdate transport system ATP-binding protein|nr:ATP-binding cassette domain-containing protein [bacterium]